MDLQEIYKALRSEYNGKTWSDEFLPTHIDLRDDQIICWFEIDEDDEEFEEKRDCAISFYDEVVRFLVDNFGEEFKYEDPRISDDYIDKNNFHGQYEIVLDDDGENPVVIAIWKNEENEMKPRFNENKKIYKEGAGAGYTVEIKGLKFGKILSKKLVPDKYYGYYECQVEILPGVYEIAAQDYYNDYFWQEHEIGVTPDAQIDGGVATVVYSKQWEDDEQSEEDLRNEVENKELDITFSYGHGWMHADLPREKIAVDHVDVNEREVYFGIDKLVLNAPDLADAVNNGYQSTFDQGEEDSEEDDEDEEEKQMDESYDPNKDEGRKRVMAALEEFRQVLWDDTKVDNKDEHDLRRTLFQDVDDKISQTIQRYFKYSRM